MTIGMLHKPDDISSVMEAANKLISVIEEDANQSLASDIGQEHGNTKTSSDGSAVKKRYLPDHKKPDAALTFPEKLMAMMCYAEQQEEGFCINWLEDGKSFIVNDAETFTKQVVPRFFKPTKFSSFTRKLYRWGFRQINRGIGQDDPIIFGNEHFKRGEPELMAKMRSTTAAATRKAEEGGTGSMQMHFLSGMKRPSEIAEIEMQQQMLLRQLLSKKANISPQQQQQQDVPVGAGMFGNFMNQSSVGNSQSCFSNAGNGNSSMSLSQMIQANSQGCFNSGGNGNNPMSLSQMIHAGNTNSMGFNMGSSVVSQPQYPQFNMSNSNMLMEQQQMMKMQQQQQQNDSLLGNFNMQQDMMGMTGHQFMQQDKVGCYNQLMQQDKMSFNQYKQQDSSQDKMMGGNSQCFMQGQNDSSLLGQFAPATLRQQGSNFLQAPSAMAQSFPNAATTADIVNAAIQALKYS